jgi:uncharacterized protein
MGVVSESGVSVVDGAVRYDGRTLGEWVPAIVGEVVRLSDPQQVVLFGSVARGDDGPDSDIDLMVVLPQIDYSERHALEARLSAAIRRIVPVQFFVTDVAECERRKDVVGSTHYWALREGQVLHSRG